MEKIAKKNEEEEADKLLETAADSNSSEQKEEFKKAEYESKIKSMQKYVSVLSEFIAKLEEAEEQDPHEQSKSPKLIQMRTLQQILLGSERRYVTELLHKKIILS